MALAVSPAMAHRRAGTATAALKNWVPPQAFDVFYELTFFIPFEKTEEALFLVHIPQSPLFRSIHLSATKSSLRAQHFWLHALEPIEAINEIAPAFFHQVFCSENFLPPCINAIYFFLSEALSLFYTECVCT